MRRRRNCSSPGSAKPRPRLTVPRRAWPGARLRQVPWPSGLVPGGAPQLCLRQRVESDHPATRHDRVELGFGRCADHDQHSARRGFFQRLEKGVRRLLVQVVRVVHNRDSPRSPHRFQSELQDEVSNDPDRQFVLVLRARPATDPGASRPELASKPGRLRKGQGDSRDRSQSRPCASFRAKVLFPTPSGPTNRSACGKPALLQAPSEARRPRGHGRGSSARTRPTSLRIRSATSCSPASPRSKRRSS